MRVGDTVLVKDTGRRALVTGMLPEGHVQVEYLPDPAEDPVDRESPGDEEFGGVYLEHELEALTSSE
jgi:hypothetical protein